MERDQICDLSSKLKKLGTLLYMLSRIADNWLAVDRCKLMRENIIKMRMM